MPKTRLSNEEAAELAAHVAELAKAGMPLSNGLRALGQELPSGRLKDVLRSMARELESGAGLDAVLESHRERFPEHVRGLLLAGLRSGRLPEVLEEFVELERDRAELRRRVWRSMAYPIALLSMMCGLVVFFEVQIIPGFARIFEGFEADLPLETQVVLKSAGPGVWFVKTMAVLIGVLLALCWAAPRASWASYLLHGVPLLGPLVRFSRLARFSRMTALLLEQDVRLPEALRLTATGMSDAWLAAGCRRVADEVEAGRSLPDALYGQPQFPTSMIPVIHWGQKESLPADAFRATSEMFEGRVKPQAVFLETILLPLTFLIVVLFVFTTAAALLLPMVSLISCLT